MNKKYLFRPQLESELEDNFQKDSSYFKFSNLTQDSVGVLNTMFYYPCYLLIEMSVSKIVNKQ